MLRFRGNQRLRQSVSSNRPAHTGPSLAVMPYPPSRVDLSPVNSATVPVGRSLDDRMINTTETQDQSNSTASPSSIVQLEHVACPHVGQDVPLVTAGVNRLPDSPLHSPATRLPPEILAYIFQFYVVHEIESTPVPVAARGSFSLAQICKFWRAVVVSDPRLWTSIQFYFPDSHQDREQDISRVKLVFDLYLKRSGTLPISLTFTDHRIYHSSTEGLISLLVDRLRVHARRWKRISLQLSCGYFPLLFTFTPCDLSSLEYLSISGDVLAQHIVTTLRLDLESATNLKSFTYCGPGHSVDDRIHVHWDNLAEVSFEFAPHNGTSSTLSRQFKHLAQCQNITTCSLGIDRPFWPGLHGGQSITLPCLQTLRVRRLSPHAQARTALDPLILPQLRTLEIDASVVFRWSERWHERTFSDLLARSACTLHHLSIRDVDFPNDDLVRCLALSPELTSFRFIPYPRSQNILDLLRKLWVPPYSLASGQTRAKGHEQGHVANGPLIPRLRQFTVATSVEEYLDPMMEMFRSRVGPRAHAAGVAALRRAEVMFFDMSHGMAVDDRTSVPRARLEKLARFQADLAQWVSEHKNENEDGLEASVVIDSPYLVEYVVVPQGRHYLSS